MTKVINWMLFTAVLAVYGGSVGLQNTRHALPCALFADAVGLVAAVVVAYAFFT